MRKLLYFSLLGSLLLSAAPFTVTKKHYELTFDGAYGMVLKAAGREHTLPCLWSVQFAEAPAIAAGQRDLTAEAFAKAPWNGKVSTERSKTAAGETAVVRYASESLTLSVTLVCGEDKLDWSAKVEQTVFPVIQLKVPAGLQFELTGMRKFVFPQRGSESHGLAFMPEYFQEHRPPHCPYRSLVQGTRGYEHLYGGKLLQLLDREPDTPIRLTDEGKALFGANGEAYFAQPRMLCVNRLPAEGQADLTLVENERGGVLSGKHFGGSGYLFRFSSPWAWGDSQNRGKQIFNKLIDFTMAGLRARSPEKFAGKKFGIVSLENGPQQGSWNPQTVAEWELCVLNLTARQASNGTFVKLQTPEAMREALRDPSFVMILNPYGEAFPSGDAAKLISDLDEIREFVKRGGYWWETSGYSFYSVLVPQPLLGTSATYPSAVADFAYADYGTESVALMGIQPQLRRPWDVERVVKPTNLSVKGTGTAAEFAHGWFFACEPGQSWQSPVWRLSFGWNDPRKALADYASSNEIGGSLEKKVPNAELLERLKGAVLVRLSVRNYAEQMAAMKTLPANNIVHYTEYLHGGFDKQYPDHLPANPHWGTNEQFKDFIMAGKKLGHLMMPYTNTSWWCIEPKGPTFEREGEAPLNRQRDGSIRYERYAKNRGCSLCFWHPAVQAAHRKVRQEMTVDYPSDILFQDQVGARSWVWNYHELEPHKASGHDGMHSLSMEDAQIVPMATEDGYDRVLNFETIICGAAWGMVPTEGTRRLNHAKYRYPKGEWQFFPILSYLGHNQCLFTTHDLGHFTDNEEKLAANLAFGYGLSLNWGSASAKNEWSVSWLNWLDALQKGVCHDYAGKKLLDFRYLEEGTARPHPHELIYARYDGDVVAVVNCGKAPLALRGLLTAVDLPAAEKAWLEQQTLCGYGFYVRSPRSRALFMAPAGQPDGAAGLALTRHDGQLQGAFYAGCGIQMTCPLAAREPAAKTLTVRLPDGQNNKVEARVADGLLTIRLPETRNETLQMPAPLAAKSPRELGYGNKVAVLHFAWKPEQGYHQDCQKILALLKEQLSGTGLEAVEVTDERECVAMLQEKDVSKRPFAIIGMGGESLCGPADVTSGQMMQFVRDYMLRGGLWWCTGGYPFYLYERPDGNGKLKREWMYTAGGEFLGIRCPAGSPEEPMRALYVSAEGEKWFGRERSERIRRYTLATQRPFLMETGVTRLIYGMGGIPYVSGYRSDGWGYVFNMGGFGVPVELTADVVAGTVTHLYHSPWEKPEVSGRRIAWSIVK